MAGRGAGVAAGAASEFLLAVGVPSAAFVVALSLAGVAGGAPAFDPAFAGGLAEEDAESAGWEGDGAGSEFDGPADGLDDDVPEGEFAGGALVFESEASEPGVAAAGLLALEVSQLRP